MKKFKNVFLAFFVTALTSLNLVLPAYAEETTTPTVDSAGFSVSVVGDGTVTLSSGDFTKSLSNGDIFNADYEEGTEIKIVSKSNENAVIDDVSLNNSTISGFTSGKKSFSFVYATKTADANFSVTFKTKETQKTESSTSDKTTSKDFVHTKSLRYLCIQSQKCVVHTFYFLRISSPNPFVTFKLFFDLNIFMQFYFLFLKKSSS